jgi:hypothetical protein
MQVNKSFTLNDCIPGKRKPEAGDKATIIEIYKNPILGYELECTNETGETEWLVTVQPSDLDLKLIHKCKKQGV